jgi:hypothetical protein
MQEFDSDQLIQIFISRTDHTPNCPIRTKYLFDTVGYITKMAGYFCFYLFFRGQGGGDAEGVDHKARLNMFSMVLSKMPKV